MSTTSDHQPQRRLLGLSSATWALMVAIVLGMVGAGIAVGLAVRDRDDARQAADAVGGQAADLVECVKGPETDCESEAAKVEETIGEVKAGDPGPAGDVGEQGPPGFDGQDGLDGADGQRGPQGPRGLRGFIGPVGPVGPTGDDGISGETGATGEPGPAGPVGPVGPAGAPGKDGADGKDGAPGTANPGTYGCPDGQYVAGLSIGTEGGVTLECRDLPTFPGGKA
jgi:hypothetical protein